MERVKLNAQAVMEKVRKNVMSVVAMVKLNAQSVMEKVEKIAPTAILPEE
jgi:hypothetical protein